MRQQKLPPSSACLFSVPSLAEPLSTCSLIEAVEIKVGGVGGGGGAAEVYRCSQEG